MNLWLVAHRGAPNQATENTLGSFTIADKYPIAYIELDVRVTHNNVAIVNHDANICDMPIDKSNYSDLLKAKPDLLSFEQVAKSDLKANLMIELKSVGSATYVLDYMLSHPRSVATGYRLGEILYLKDHGVEPSRLFFAHHYQPFGIKKAVQKHSLGGMSFDYRYFWAFLRKTDKRRMAYTVNSVRVAKLLRKLIPDCLICTNDLDKFSEVTNA